MIVPGPDLSRAAGPADLRALATVGCLRSSRSRAAPQRMRRHGQDETCADAGHGRPADACATRRLRPAHPRRDARSPRPAARRRQPTSRRRGPARPHRAPRPRRPARPERPACREAHSRPPRPRRPRAARRRRGHPAACPRPPTSTARPTTSAPSTPTSHSATSAPPGRGSPTTCGEHATFDTWRQGFDATVRQATLPISPRPSANAALVRSRSRRRPRRLRQGDQRHFAVTWRLAQRLTAGAPCTPRARSNRLSPRRAPPASPNSRRERPSLHGATGRCRALACSLRGPAQPMSTARRRRRRTSRCPEPPGRALAQQSDDRRGVSTDPAVQLRRAPVAARAARSARRAARRSPRGSCSSESRSRSVTVSSSSVWWSIVTAYGVPISSWRR